MFQFCALVICSFFVFVFYLLLCVYLFISLLIYLFFVCIFIIHLFIWLFIIWASRKPHYLSTKMLLIYLCNFKYIIKSDVSLQPSQLPTQLQPHFGCPALWFQSHGQMAKSLKVSISLFGKGWHGSLASFLLLLFFLY